MRMRKNGERIKDWSAEKRRNKTDKLIFKDDQTMTEQFDISKITTTFSYDI